MSQYKLGKVFVTNASAIVYADASALWGTITAGNLFAILGDGASYEVAAVEQVAEPALYGGGGSSSGILNKGADGKSYVAITSWPIGDDHYPPDSNYWMEVSRWKITLTAPYAGSTGANKTYAITKDFTANYSLPMPSPGDIETGSLISRAFQKLDTILTPLGGASVSVLRDDFIHGVVGELPWNIVYQGGPAPGIIHSAPELNHPGKISFETTALGGLHLAADDTIPFKGIALNHFEMVWIFKIAGIGAVPKGLYVGLKDTFVGYGNNMIGLYVYPALHGNYFFVRTSDLPSGGVLDTVIAPADNNWHKLRVRRISEGRIGFTLDAGVETVHTSRIPLDVALVPGMILEAEALTTAGLELDYFSIAATISR
jgi:hypothetical protein